MQSVSLFGMACLSFLLYWIQLFIADRVVEKRFTWRSAQAPVMVLTALLVYGGFRLNLAESYGKPAFPVAAVGTDSRAGGWPLPSRVENLEVKARLFERTRKAAASGARLIVWNEAATFTMPDEEERWVQDLSSLALENRIFLYASFIVPVSLDPLF